MATTADYLNKLVEQKNALADNLVTKGVTASYDETLETLIPKVLDIDGGTSLLPKPIGLTYYFDYQNGVDVENNNWTDIISGIVCISNLGFDLKDGYIEMATGSKFSLGFGEGISSYTIYIIACEPKYISEWATLVGDAGTTPQFNLCNVTGVLGIGSGSEYGGYTGNVKSYDEWHVCCLTLNEKFGILYIDGERKHSYDGYAIPRFTDLEPLLFGYGNIKMMAVCPNVVHSKNIVAENSEYLKSKYIS